MNDIFDDRSASPMLLMEGKPFDSKNHIYELKLDGIRCLAYLDSTATDLVNKRGKHLNETYPELCQLHKQIKKRCILDGELMVLNNGKPDFFELQRRSLMSGKLKINIASQRLPVQFVAFDILYLDATVQYDVPLMDRKAYLFKNTEEGGSLAISRYIEEKGIDFFKLAESRELEGIVAKRKDSLYYPGRRTRDWVKFKRREESDLIICGYVPADAGGIKSILLGAYDSGGKLVSQGHVAMGIPSSTTETILRFQQQNPALCPFAEPCAEPDARWMKPGLVCTVQYMMRTTGGYFRQPVFKCLQEDKAPEECIYTPPVKPP